MDSVRFGLSVRALRHRRGWTQAELAHHAGLSQSAISRIERGAGDALTVRLLSRVAGVMGARIRMQVLWQGEELDRLLDAAHARLVERVIALLVEAGWQVTPEVTYRFGMERGSIDVLALQPGTRDLLVVEVNRVVPDMGGLLAGLDRKGRVALEVARERGWRATRVSRVLVLADDPHRSAPARAVRGHVRHRLSGPNPGGASVDRHAGSRDLRGAVPVIHASGGYSSPVSGAATGGHAGRIGSLPTDTRLTRSWQLLLE